MPRRASSCGTWRSEPLAAAERDGEQVHPETTEAVELIERVGAWWFAKHETPVETRDVSKVDPPGFVAVEWTAVKTAVKELGISEQAVTALCRRGTLRAEKIKGAWRIDAAAVTARKDRSHDHSR